LNERIAHLQSTLAASCADEREQLWEATPGGGCSRALDAERKVELLEQQLAEARTVYAFRYSSCTHEEGMRVISLHSKHSSAVEALELHRAKSKAEWTTRYDETDKDHRDWLEKYPWVEETGSGSECWDVCAMQIDAAITSTQEQTA